MKQVETEGATLDEAIANALDLLGVERDNVSLDVLVEEKTGLLGFGRQNARVRVTIREAVAVMSDEEPRDSELPPVLVDSEAADTVSATDGTEDEGLVEEFATTEDLFLEARNVSVDVLGEMLRLMGVVAEVVVSPGSDPSEFILDIQSDSSALLIGRRGQTLDSLQYVLSRIVAIKVGLDGPQPVVDVEDYVGRRTRSLEDMALRLGEKAKRSREAQEIDALSARDRRIVHLALKDDPWLTTKSLGQGACRRLLIVPEGDRKPPDTRLPQ